MRLTRLAMDNFGPFSGHTVGDFSSGLTVVHGENEAGKSALRAFMRVILFGFPRARTSDHAEYFYQPALPGGAGGTLFVTARNGDPYAISRVEGVRGGPVTVSGSREGGEDLLRELTGGVDDAFYQNVFSISLTQLQSFEDAGRDEITERIYSAGLGMGSISLRGVARQLDDRIAVFRRVRSGSLYDLEKELRETRDQLEDRRRELAGYDGLSDELRSLESTANELNEEINGVRSTALRTRRLLELRDPWLRLRRLRSEVARLPATNAIPINGIERLDKFTRDIEGLESQLDEGDRQERERQRRTSELPVIDAFTSREADVRAATSQIAYYQEAVQDLPKREAEAAEIESGVERDLSAIGPNWSVERVKGFDNAAGTIASIQAEADSLAQAQRASAQAELDLKSAEQESDRVKEALRTSESQLADAPDSTSDSVESLERKRDRLATLEAALAELDANQARGVATKPTPSLPGGALLGAIIAIGGLLGLLLAFVLGELASGLTGVVAVLAGVAIFIRSRNQPSARAEDRQDQSAVQAEVESLAGELELELPLPVRAVVEIRNSVGRAIDRKREHAALERSFADARQASENADTRRTRASEALKQHEQELAEADTAWSDLLVRLDLHTHFDRDGALAAVNSLSVLAGRTREATELRRRADAMRAQNSQTDRLLVSIYEEAGLDPITAGDGLASLRDLERRWEAHVEAVGRFQDLRRDSEDWVDRRASIGDSLKRARKGLSELLEQASCQTADQFRDLASQVETGRQLERDIEALKNSSPELFGKDTAQLDESLESALPEELEAELVALQESEGALREQRDSAMGRAGEVRAALNQLETEAEVARLHTRIDELTERLREDARQWSVLTVARSLLDQTREEFQEQRQPALLQSASNYFNSMTLGRYTGVRAVVGEERFEAITGDGLAVPPERLSRGAAEQLWLSIRFALVDEYSAQTPLPVVLDDLLVNFDPRRTRAACSAITALAERQQVIFLTCQPSTVDMLKEAGRTEGTAISLIDLSEGAGSTSTTPSPTQLTADPGSVDQPESVVSEDAEPVPPRMQQLL